jgi:CheY-specific phosphatase CheX
VAPDRILSAHEREVRTDAAAVELTGSTLMQPFEQEIVTLSESIWLSVLGLALQPSPTQAGALPNGPTLDGIVTISGDWQGAVILQMPRDLAHRVAAIMFSLGEQPATLEDMQDALGEITNMTGGNLKALMPGNCFLSLPAVVDGNDYRLRIPTATVLSRILFHCEGHPTVVSLVAAGTI